MDTLITGLTVLVLMLLAMLGGVLVGVIALRLRRRPFDAREWSEPWVHIKDKEARK